MFEVDKMSGRQSARAAKPSLKILQQVQETVTAPKKVTRQPGTRAPGPTSSITGQDDIEAPPPKRRKVKLEGEVQKLDINPPPSDEYPKQYKAATTSYSPSLGENENIARSVAVNGSNDFNNTEGTRDDSYDNIKVQKPTPTRPKPQTNKKPKAVSVGLQPQDESGSTPKKRGRQKKTELGTATTGTGSIYDLPDSSDVEVRTASRTLKAKKSVRSLKSPSKSPAPEQILNGQAEGLPVDYSVINDNMSENNKSVKASIKDRKPKSTVLSEVAPMNGLPSGAPSNNVTISPSKKPRKRNLKENIQPLSNGQILLNGPVGTSNGSEGGTDARRRSEVSASTDVDGDTEMTTSPPQVVIANKAIMKKPVTGPETPKKRGRSTKVMSDAKTLLENDQPTSEEDMFLTKSVRKRTPKLIEEFRHVAQGDVIAKPTFHEPLETEVAKVDTNEDDEDALFISSEKFEGTVSKDALHFLKKHVLSKVMGRKHPSKLVGLKDEYKTVHQLLEQTVAMGEGNSMILIGPRGSGKTALVENSIQKLRQEHGKDFLVVRLNGYVQTDEKLAVRDIWRQLGSAMEIDDNKPINFADTLTSILALLSHPTEHSVQIDDTECNNTETTSVSVVFLLSEFEMFAGFPRQTLLYNLFDIAQARKAPIAVVGMTTRIDVVEMLEKRVKSRFSHRTLGVKIGGNLGGRIEGWWEVLKSLLCVDEDVIADETNGFSSSDIAYFQEYNKRLGSIFKQDLSFRKIVNSIYAKSKEVKGFLNQCIIPINELTIEEPFLTSGEALLKDVLAAPDNKLYLLEDLTELSLSLLICAARLDPILETDTCNFTMVYDEYKTLVGRVKITSQSTWSMKVWGKDVALAAWEKLSEWELIIPSTGGGLGGAATAANLIGAGGSAGMGRREARMYRVDVGLLEIKRQGRQWGMSGILQNWCTIG